MQSMVWPQAAYCSLIWSDGCDHLIVGLKWPTRSRRALGMVRSVAIQEQCMGSEVGTMCVPSRTCRIEVQAEVPNYAWVRQQ